MFERLRTGRQGISAFTVAGLVFAWLTLFCGHCLALGATGNGDASAAGHCIHAGMNHDGCGTDRGCQCHHDGQMQAVPLGDTDALLPASNDLHPFPVAIVSRLLLPVFAGTPIRAGPDYEHPDWKTPPLFLLHRVLRD